MNGPKLYILFLIGIIASVFQPGYNPFKNISKEDDKGTTNHIVWSVYLTQLAVVIEFIYFRYPAGAVWNLVTWAALLVMIIGLAIRTWSVFTLGQYFTMHITVQKKQPVIKNGPYKYVRHPSYLGACLTYTCSSIFFHSWFSLVLSIVILPIAFCRRIYHEEKLLKDKLGKDYEIYCASRKKLIPGIW